MYEYLSCGRGRELPSSRPATSTGAIAPGAHPYLRAANGLLLLQETLANKLKEPGVQEFSALIVVRTSLVGWADSFIKWK